MTILEIQEALQLRGWRWRETTFSDSSNDCYIVFTKDPTPSYFLENVNGDIGWGRFPRLQAWQMAYDYFILGIRERPSC